MKKEYMIFIVIAVLGVLVFSSIVSRNSQSNHINKLSETEAVFENSEEYNKRLEEVFSNLESEYKENLGEYSRDIFYNQSRINDMIRDNFEKIELVQDIGGEVYQNFQEEVEFSNIKVIETGNTYLIKYQNDYDFYTYYFIGELTNKGFRKFYLYAVTKEKYVNDRIEEYVNL